MPKLTVSLPDGTETVHDLLEDVISVGRVDDNMIEIADPSVSSRHAQLTKDDGDYVLRDLGSTNGTQVNGREAPEGEDIKLANGYTIVFGKVGVLYASETTVSSLPLPEEESVAAMPASASARPADFANASPFSTKKKKRDGAGIGIMILGIVALLAFGGAASLIFGMTSPL